ncbi:hypothetical protein [Rhodococcus chondri]|uniref:Lipoprotein n=1 Tax=Rhodococcus chondri TaxID=3065941 RepID=A0ABU7JW75_9NOCA|nr:hypothetical protein [Rhodococcus sp. CC-R104]MEE2033537.1 hypothetical protein [Rhodococcus sp. CC-R104]
MVATLFVAVLSGCAGAEPPADEVVTFTVGETIPVTVTLRSADDGGRSTPFYSGYRPQVLFASSPDPVPCTFSSPDGGFPPDTTADIEITCAHDVTVEPAQAGFVFEESGREVGSGSVAL